MPLFWPPNFCNPGMAQINQMLSDDLTTQHLVNTNRGHMWITEGTQLQERNTLIGAVDFIENRAVYRSNNHGAIDRANPQVFEHRFDLIRRHLLKAGKHQPIP